MKSRHEITELDIRRSGQELAVAWRKGRAAYVLDRLEAEPPLRAALVATLVERALSRWDPYDSKWPNGFRHALLLRSQGILTPDELAELEREYLRHFGAPPPRPPGAVPDGDLQERRRAELYAARLGEALAEDRPLVRERSPDATSPMFLRLQPARR